MLLLFFIIIFLLSHHSAAAVDVLALLHSVWVGHSLTLGKLFSCLLESGLTVLGSLSDQVAYFFLFG